MTTTKTSNSMQAILARAAELAATTVGSGRKQPKACACGCGVMTKGGTWVPGHDAKALAAATDLVRAGKQADPAAVLAELAKRRS